MGVMAARDSPTSVVFRRGLVSVYLVGKGIDLRGGLVAIWVPFLAADLGNFAWWRRIRILRAL